MDGIRSGGGSIVRRRDGMRGSGMKGGGWYKKAKREWYEREDGLKVGKVSDLSLIHI